MGAPVIEFFEFYRGGSGVITSGDTAESPEIDRAGYDAQGFVADTPALLDKAIKRIYRIKSYEVTATCIKTKISDGSSVSLVAKCMMIGAKDEFGLIDYLNNMASTSDPDFDPGPPSEPPMPGDETLHGTNGDVGLGGIFNVYLLQDAASDILSPRFFFTLGGHLTLSLPEYTDSPNPDLIDLAFSTIAGIDTTGLQTPAALSIFDETYDMAGGGEDGVISGVVGDRKLTLTEIAITAKKYHAYGGRYDEDTGAPV